MVRPLKKVLSEGEVQRRRRLVWGSIPGGGVQPEFTRFLREGELLLKRRFLEKRAQENALSIGGVLSRF